VWFSSARDTLSLQVGQGQDSSIGLKSFACLLSSGVGKVEAEDADIS
jgi:hypothetical protein